MQLLDEMRGDLLGEWLPGALADLLAAWTGGKRADILESWGFRRPRAAVEAETERTLSRFFNP